MYTRETRQRRVRKIIPILKEDYPNAGSRLNFSSPFELLIASILAAQCTDDKVNEVTRDLFAKYRTARDYVEADLEELMEDIYSTGTYRKKAIRIKKVCEAIVRQHNGEVPSTMGELTALPGVGRKTANMILVNGYNQPGIIVDTHVARVAERIGLTDKNKNQADKIEADLMDVVARKNWSIFSHLLLFHGRAACVSRKPKCDLCSIRRFCDYYRVTR